MFLFTNSETFWIAVDQTVDSFDGATEAVSSYSYIGIVIIPSSNKWPSL